MKIDFPDLEIGQWKLTPWWLFWKPAWRRRHWYWTYNWDGCQAKYVWQYSHDRGWGF